MTRRRSKRKAVVLETMGGRRRSSRSLSRTAKQEEIYGKDCGILPSDWSAVLASAIPGRVPLGFVCGYPLLQGGGELYGGSMFARSAAADTRQGQAMQRVNERWGSDTLDRAGRESLGMAVCKKKYTPFVFPLHYNHSGSSNSTSDAAQVQVTVERRLGCRAHHALRQAVVAQHGLRPGWEPFGQWTMRKAQDLARKEAHRRNKRVAEADGATTTEDEVSLASAEDATGAGALYCLPTHAQNNFRSLCWNGNCVVKHPSMFDDVEEECRALQAEAAAKSAADDEEDDEKDTKPAASKPTAKRPKR